MTKRNKGSGNRRESLLRSLERTGEGGFSTYAANLMATPLGGNPAECTITGHCRTSIFKYPGSRLVEPADHQIVYLRDSLRAAIVSDLPAYFEQNPADSLHYSIDVSLRAGVRKIYKKAVEQVNQQTPPKVSLFLVVEEHTQVPSTVLNSGECFAIDECREGEALIEGGREGERTLLAVKTINGSWPDFYTDTHRVNLILAAVKAEENVTHHELYMLLKQRRSCCMH